ncbi:hypothetical protein CC78DRAFT_613153 [Lojkania enalia]|uniref:SURF6-domain-containing protein n=1 Tax=Lojkania enalia TaxID=147567 RepID=A0A9P4KHS6_9PLEO|nr:hypothetical protein CC78DRAFT_613153 [Didymosphaeria enalia]
MADDLEERLKSHARAFEGLMSLIPANEYYGKDESITSTQWMRKKQTMEERKAAKRAKLDPASHKTAKDVMNENARKRKRELEGDGTSDIDMDIGKEKPLEGMKMPSSKTKKHKTTLEPEVSADDNPIDAGNNDDTQESRLKVQADKRKQKLDSKKGKLAKKQERQQIQRARQKEFGAALGCTRQGKEGDEDEDQMLVEEDHGDDHIQSLDIGGLVDEAPSTSTLSTDSNNSTASVVSAASSSSSIVPSGAGDSPKILEEKKAKLDPKEQEAFRARLLAKLEAMRAARKADGPDGRPARNRAELIEARRKKEAARKEAKKESRQIAKEDEARLRAEAELARLRGGSGSPSLFPRIMTPEQEQHLAFGKVAWKDGQQLDSTLSRFFESKKKGSSNAKTALEAAQKKRSRINGLNEERRKDIEKKDSWLNAKKRAQGEKVHDDAALLRKSVKRKEKTKAKSTMEWNNRLTGIQKVKGAKQARREENLRKRREEKKSGKGKRSKKPAKKTRRPGFEGTFKAR